MAKKDIRGIEVVPFQGGQNSYLETALIPTGRYSALQNFRQMHPGLKKRPGQVKTHWSADSTNRVVSLYQYSKGASTERHLYAQMSDGDVLESYASPPTIGEELMTLDVAPSTAWSVGDTITDEHSHTCIIVKYLTSLTYIVKSRSGTFTLSDTLTNGTYTANQGAANPTFANAVFGDEVHNGTASGMIPASWSNYDEAMIYSNGSDQHQIYYGQSAKILKFIVYKGSASIPDFPIMGSDFTSEINDGISTTVAVLDSLGDLDVDYDCIFFCLPVPGHTLNLTVSAANSSCAIAQLKYRKNDSTWASATGFVDGTLSPSYYLTFEDAMAATTNWTAVDANLTSDAGGQSGNMLTVAESGGANPGKAYKDMTTVVGQKYWLKYYFKKGTADNGKVMVGTTSDEDSIYDSTNLSDANWTLHETGFTATETTTRLTLQTNDSTAGETSLFDTISVVTGSALGKSGAMTWTKPGDSAPSYMFNTYGYWYQLSLSVGELDSEVEVSAASFESSWNSLQNIWDGILVDGIEAQFYVLATTKYLTFGTDSIDLDAMATGDYLYAAFSDPQEALYFDVGDVPSTTASNTIDGLDYWNGTAWTTVGSFTDNTIGLTQSGIIMIPRRASGLEQSQNFNNTQYYAYWYRISVNKALSATVNVGIQGIPTFDISDFGQKGRCSSPWKQRMVYTFDQNPDYIYITAEGYPQALNGGGYDIKLAGDGRGNPIVCMKPFYNELMVWQNERGVEGGCITVFDGYNPQTFGRMVLSTKYGTMNSQSVTLIEGFTFGGEQEAGLIAFFLSRYGIMYTDGKTVSHVPNYDEIKNYFDPSNSSCIRTGYESHMWLKYDSAFNILRIGLVTGSGTVCNTFLTYDLTGLSWGTDSYAQELACFTEAEAASGTSPVLQLGGGVDDGFVYLLNSGLNDVSTAIDSYVTVEFDAAGNEMRVDDIVVRMKSQSSGSITVTPYENGIARTAETFEQTAAVSNQYFRRHRRQINIAGNHVSLKYQHNTASESCYLLDHGEAMAIYEGQ